METREAVDTKVGSHEVHEGGHGESEPIERRLRARAIDAISGSILVDPYRAMAGDPPQELINASAAYHARDVETLRALLPDVTAVAALAVDHLEAEGTSAQEILRTVEPGGDLDLRALDERAPAPPDTAPPPPPPARPKTSWWSSRRHRRRA